MADPNIVQYHEYFYLRNEQTGQYLCAAYSGMRYYFPKLGKRSKARLQLRGGRGSLEHNDNVKFRSMQRVTGDRDVLGAFGDSRNCYYWTNSNVDKQRWTIRRLHRSSDRLIRYGDTVRITNVAYKGQRFVLDSNDPRFLTTKRGGHDTWVLEPTRVRHTPAVAARAAPEKAFEEIPDGEAEQIQAVADLTVELLDKRYRAPDRVLRGVHPKAHGCVKAVFEINEDVAEELRVGLFAKPGKRYKAWIRFSNATARAGPDIDESGHKSRGMAVKVLNTGGKVLLEDEGARHQDFLMITEPAFAFANVADYLRLTRVLRGDDDNPGRFFAPLNPGAKGFSKEETVRTRRTLGLFKEIGTTPVVDLLKVQYYGAAPFLFGPGRVMKVSAKPRSSRTRQVIPKNPTDDYLRQSLLDTMNKDKDVCFDFMVQVRGEDDEGLNIEDASTAWDEKRFPFIKVATITIPAPQRRVDSSAAIERGEKLSYSPWHALQAHRPLGGINRLRKAVYLASWTHRSEQSD